MAVKQKEKTEITRKELKNAALQMYLNKGYEETSIKDITNLAGYAVGTFYRHWKSKQQLLMELWDNFASDFIKESIKNSPEHVDKQRMIEYLIMRSNTFAEHEITIKLFLTSQIISAQSSYEDISEWAHNYTDMLYRFLRDSSGTSDETFLHSMASIMHTLLNAHAIQKVEPHIINNFDNKTLSQCLLAMVNACSENAN